MPMAAFRIQGATWTAARVESDQMRAGRLLLMGRIGNGRQLREKKRENDDSKMQDHMHSIEILLASAQVKILILPLE